MVTIMFSVHHKNYATLVKSFVAKNLPAKKKEKGNYRKIRKKWKL